MLNKSTSRSEYVVQSGVTLYPVGFKFLYNGDDTPQIRVTIGDVVAVENLHFVITEDLLNIKLIPLEEEAPADPNDYSWLEKWVGMSLVIERDIPFVQESDYRLGRISPEQIERDFDLSVMRDQELAQADEDIATEVALAKARLSVVEGDVSWLNDKTSELEGAISEEAENRAHDDGILLEKIEQLNDRNEDYREEAANAIAAEATTRSEADTALQEAISKEIGERTAVDTNLTNLIADTNNTIANVLGMVRDVDAKVGTKQDKLVAGTNIKIEGNTISAEVSPVDLSDLENAVSVLRTDVELSTEPFAETVVLLDELYTSEIDGRPDYKKPGATVYAENGIAGIIDTVDESAGTATIVTVPAGGARFPDQTDKAGKVLQTNGSEVIWSLGTIIFTERTAPYNNDGSVIITGDGYQQLKEIGRGSIIIGGSLFGQTPTVQNATVIGVGSYAQDGATAIGYRAGAMGRHSVQLGEGVNSDANTFKVSNESGNFEMMSADGTVPTDRYTTTPTTAGTYVPKLIIAGDGTATREWGAESGGGGDTTQFEQLPTPSADYVGKILQYVGEDGTYKSGHFYKCVETADIMGMGYTMDGTSITVTVDTQKFLAQNPVWADQGVLVWRADGGGSVWSVWTQDPALSLTDDELRNTWGVAVNTSDGSPYTGSNASITVQNMGSTYAWIEVELGGEGPDLSNYLQLSGGTMTGPITVEWSGNYLATAHTILKSKYHRQDTGTIVSYDVLKVLPTGAVEVAGNIEGVGSITPRNTTSSLGNTYQKFWRIHVQSIYNGDIIQVPAKAGTMALVEDIDAVVGDISTALTAIIGE